MERYLRRNRLAEAMDGLGVRAVILLGALIFFVVLWGLNMPALMAGAALGVLGMLLRSRRRKHTVERRGRALRSRLGAELMLEEMLLSEPRQAHFRAAVLLAERWEIAMQSVKDEGVLCRQGGRTLLVQCLRMPPEGELSVGDLLNAVRAVRRLQADKAVLCVLGRVPAKVAARAEEMIIPIRIIRRETLMSIAAAYAPATDEQLIELGRRRHRPAEQGIARLVFRRDKARRYYLYGLLMLVMYVLTGARLYAVPGMVCLTMAVFSRISRSGETVL